MTTFHLPTHHPLLEKQSAIISRNSDQFPSLEDDNKSTVSSSLQLNSTRRSRRRRKKPTAMNKMEGVGVVPGRGRVLLSRESAWGNESQMLEEALSRSTSSLHSREDDALRRYAVDHLEKLLAKWSPNRPESTCRSENERRNPWQKTRPALVTFGSYRLGVHRADSDLDVLGLCPPEFTRADFFHSWVDLLKEDSLISKVHPIPQAYTPVIKFFFKNTIQVDMLFARLADGKKLREFQQQRVAPTLFSSDRPNPTNRNTTMEIPRRTEYCIDDSDLKDQDEAGVRSLNGARVSQILLEMVPDLDKFRTVLRAIKEWAVAKGIYSNVLGFLGGVNFAILVAQICQEYPNADAPSLLKYFFQTFWTWNWPDPVRLVPIQSQPPEGAPLMPAWDPQRYPRDGLHVMPIVTPAYPSMNSSYNVGIPQRRRITGEMIEACKLLSSAPAPPPTIKNNTSGGMTNALSKLFEPSNFFDSHEHFLQVSIRAPNEQDFMEWFRLVESKLRLLITSLDTMELQAWPYSHFFECKYDEHGNALGKLGRSEKDCMHESLFFIALRFAPGMDDLNLLPFISDFLHKVNSWPGRKTENMDLSLAHVTSGDLPHFVRPRKPDVSQKENNRGNEYLNQSNQYGGRGEVHMKKNHFHKRSNHPIVTAQFAGPRPSKQDEDGTNINIPGSSSSSVSCERAETEETQSLASDVSFADTHSSCSSGGSNSTNPSFVINSSPMKRICVVGASRNPPDSIGDYNTGESSVAPEDQE